MTTSIDTNVFLALWNPSDTTNLLASEVLGVAAKRGRLVATGIVYAELMAGRPAHSLDHFFEATGIVIEWPVEEKILRLAGEAYQGYVLRRRRSHGTLPRRLLTDFLIAAHAQLKGYSLLTFDQRGIKAAFPDLSLVPVKLPSF
jgi:predicted nucleic acid-binding protein